MADDTKHPKEGCVLQRVWVLKGITYVPHYRNSKLFVGPGYPRYNKSVYTEEFLLMQDAESATIPLWGRPDLPGAVDEANP